MVQFDSCIIVPRTVNMKVVIGVLVALLLVDASSAFMPYADIGARIVGGKDAYPGEFPYQVSMQWGLPPFLSLTHVCGGSIINENWILTAGHCVTSVPRLGKTNIKVGKHHILKDDENVQVIQIAKKIVHQEYPGNVAPYDIALLKLKTPLTFNKRVQSVKLPQQDAVQSGEAVLSGWGSISKRWFPKLPRTLQTATIPIVQNDECEKAIKVISSAGELYPSQLCTGPLDGTTSACSGDSGGPLVQYDENHAPVQVGIVSWGMYPCGAVGAPSVYTRVSSYIDWISKTIAEN